MWGGVRKCGEVKKTGFGDVGKCGEVKKGRKYDCGDVRSVERCGKVWGGEEDRILVMWEGVRR